MYNLFPEYDRFHVSACKMKLLSRLLQNNFLKNALLAYVICLHSLENKIAISKFWEEKFEVNFVGKIEDVKYNCLRD